MRRFKGADSIVVDTATVLVANDAFVCVGDLAAAVVATDGGEEDDEIAEVGVTGDRGLVGDAVAASAATVFFEGISTSSPSPSPSSSSSESIPLTEAGTPKFLFIKNPAALPYPT